MTGAELGAAVPAGFGVYEVMTGAALGEGVPAGFGL
jgi:hypothetical protein